MFTASPIFNPKSNPTNYMTKLVIRSAGNLLTSPNCLFTKDFMKKMEIFLGGTLKLGSHPKSAHHKFL